MSIQHHRAVGSRRGRRASGRFPNVERLEARALMATIADPSFENFSVGAGFRYAPTGTAWTYSGSAALAADSSAFTVGSPTPPSGGQVVALQAGGSITQVVAGWAAGTYTLSFQAARRDGSPFGLAPQQQDFTVAIDGTVVGTYKPTRTSYQAFTTTPLALAAGAHTITFQGLDSAGGDNTAFIDDVATDPAPAAVPQVADPDFGAVDVSSGLNPYQYYPAGSAAYQYNPTGSPWTFTGHAAVAANGSAFTVYNPPAPEGNQVAALQNDGAISQSISGWTAGSYTISFLAAQRSSTFTGLGTRPGQDFQVLVDGNVVKTVTPTFVDLTNQYYGYYEGFTTAAFTVAAGAHTIAFRGLDSAGGDNTAFISAVSLARVPAAALGDAGFEATAYPAGVTQFDPTGSAWTYTGAAGVASANAADALVTGPFLGLTFPAQDNQTALIQADGSISQAVANWDAGTYDLSFLARQRNNQGNASDEAFQVLIDGTVVGTIAPKSDRSNPYVERFVTAPFTVTAGTHTIAFRGLGTATTDANLVPPTVYIDAVAINTLGS